MIYLKTKKLFENQNQNNIYVTKNFNYNFFTTDIEEIPFLIEDGSEDNLKSIKPDRQHYLNDKNTQLYSYEKEYHASVGWLSKSIETYKLSGEKIENYTDKILYICKDFDIPTQFIYMVINDKTSEDEIIDFFKDYVDFSIDSIKKSQYTQYFIINDDDDYTLKIMKNAQERIIKKNTDKFKI